MLIRREFVGALGALLLTGCAAAAAEPDVPASATPATVGAVGVLPPLITSEVAATAPPTRQPEVSTVDTAADVITVTAAGNRVLMIGDSILASTSRRYSNDMCSALVPLGWQVAVEAEVSRQISFGQAVLDARLRAGWDVGVVFLGTNYNGDEQDYLRRLNDIVTDFGEVPVVLVTVAARRDSDQVNATIRAMTDVYPNVSVVDWEQMATADPNLLLDDGIHPTTAGREVLATAMADRLGTASVVIGEPGTCLSSVFTDDSAGTVDGRPAAATVKPRPTATTVKPPTPTSTTASTTITTPTSTTASITPTATPAPTTTAPPTVTAPTATPAPTPPTVTTPTAVTTPPTVTTPPSTVAPAGP